jgi:WD repeat-containing protein 26
MLELDSHSDEVWYLEFSHDGSKLATASKDQTVMIYETGTFTILHRLTDHAEKVTYVTWSPDDSKLISCSMDNKARVWDVSVRKFHWCSRLSLKAYESFRVAAASGR